jgi:Flp pilus assembly protein TadD
MELTVDQALQQGVAAHKEGKLQDAERLYRAILQAHPKHPDANHNLGVLAVAVGKPLEALPLFKLALEVNPKIEQFWLSYADVLIKLERFDEAKRALIEGEKSGVALEQPDALKQWLKESEPKDTTKTEKGQTLSEKRKKLAEKKKGKKRAAQGNALHAAPSQDQINRLVEHYEAGRSEETEALAKSLTQQFPKHPFGWKVLGAVFQQLGKLSESLAAKQKAAERSPKDAEAHSNLGNTLQELGRLDEAEASYKQAIALKPDYAEAHNNLGITLQGLGRLDEAEASLRQAIKLKPDYAEAHNSLGVTLQKLGRLNEAEASYEHALALKPDFTSAQDNLVNLLTIYSSRKKSSQLIVQVDQEIKAINLGESFSGVISNEEIIHLFDKSSNIIKKHGLDLATELSQAHRNNSIDLNCERHFKIFDTFNVIPKFCFGCYKVQVEPRSVLELIKLLVVFDQIKLSENNTRKCMIEMRSAISGFYKGLIYCSSPGEAYQIADYLEAVIKEKIGPGLPLTVKRGCSEYSIAFPDYEKINMAGAQQMNYQEEWKLIENDYDSKNAINSENSMPPSLSCLSLSDVLIIRNWVEYAKGIGDPSAQLLKQNGVGSQRVFEIAKSRLKTHEKKKPVS